MSQDKEDFLPTILPESVPEPIYLDETADVFGTRKADIQLFNVQLKLLNSLWPQVRSVKTALAVHDRIMEMIPKRRALLGQEYGAPTNKITRSTVFEPVD